MKIKGDNNTIINNDNSQNVNIRNLKFNKKKKLGLFSIITIILAIASFYLDYHKRIAELLGISINNNMKENSSYYEKSVKPAEKEKNGKYTIVNQLEVDLQAAKKTNDSGKKNIAIKKLVNDCLVKNRFYLAIQAAEEHTRKGSEILLESIIEKALSERHYESAKLAASKLNRYKKRKEWDQKIKDHSKF